MIRGAILYVPVHKYKAHRKVFVCLTGPYLTRRATIGWLELPLGRGRFVGPSLRAAPTSITAYTVRGSSV